MRGTLNPDDEFILVQYAEILLQLAVEQGGQREAVLAQAGIPVQQLNDAAGMLTLRQFQSLIEVARQVTANDALGLDFGRRLKFTTHGALSQAAVSCDTLQEALESLIRYYPTRFAGFDLRFYRDGEDAVIQLDDLVGLDHLEPFMVEALFTSIMEVNLLLFGTTLITEGSCRIRYARPDYADAYRSVFYDGVSFSRTANQLRFKASYLDSPMALANPVTRRLAEEQCEAALRQAQVRESIVMRVRQRLESAGDSLPDMERLAGEMHMTSRTLRRQLESFGVRYQELVNQIRMERAQRLLTSTRRPVEAIAEQLGYSDPSNFGRAFRRWTGVSPSDYRRQGARDEQPSP
ncbi:AraC family transcriptional regulator [Marinobacteraceae bacterium S3BR75-40.1]